MNFELAVLFNLSGASCLENKLVIIKPQTFANPASKSTRQRCQARQYLWKKIMNNSQAPSYK